MKLTAEEEKFVQPYLLRDAEGGEAWAKLLAIVGLLFCAGGIVLFFTGLGSEVGAFAIVFVVGLVIIEQALNARDTARLASILQKYDRAARPQEHDEDEEVTM